MGLLDAAQAASNAAASTVSGPVDMLAWLLRKAGVNVGEPVGGSDWMKRKGLTKDVAPGASQVVGETLGLLAPTVAAAKAPQIAKGLLAAADNLAAPRTLNPQQGAIVWHGSPHKFDRFDSSKIGTGEGAQAYGHGLYFAEKPGVAEAYAQMLGGGKTYFLDGAPVKLKNMSPAEQAALQAMTDLPTYGPTKAAYIARLDEQGAQPKHLERISKAWDELAKRNPSLTVDNGSLYKVDLPDPAIARMLDWDKPLSQQAPKVREAAAALGVGRPYLAGMPAREVEAQGLQVYNDLSKRTRGGKAVADAEAAKVLRNLGIPGIRYLDGGSRGAGSGTSNFVVFPGEEGLLTILERNGVPLR